jgi:hypothetical protein
MPYCGGVDAEVGAGNGRAGEWSSRSAAHSPRSAELVEPGAIPSQIPAVLLGAPVIRRAVAWEIEQPEVVRDFPGMQHVRANRRQALLRIPEVATCAVQDGARVFYEPAPDAHPGDIAALLHATVTALLLAQQGRFALHATSVRVEGMDLAIAGARGAGKSTAALALAARGHQVLCDDVLPLEPEAHQTRHVPTTRPVRIAPETARALGIDGAEAPEPGPRAAKLALPCERVEPARLDAIVVLRRRASANIRPRSIERPAALPLVFAHAYRRGLLTPWHAEIFVWATQVAATVPLFVLDRPESGWTADSVACAVEEVAASIVSTAL